MRRRDVRRARRRGAPCGCVAVILVLLLSALVAALIVVVPALRENEAAEKLLSSLGPTIAQLSKREDPKRQAELEALAAQEDGLAYAALGEAQQRLYIQMLYGVKSLEQSFEVEDSKAEDIEPSYRAVIVDHPELFWVDGSTHFVFYDNGGPITITPGLTLPLAQVDEVRTRIEATADGFLSTLPADADEYTIAKMAYEYLIGTTDYDATAAQNQNIQSVFIGHASVCAGYSRAYQYLLQRAGMFCSYVEGNIASRDEDHAWNLVRINGQYSYVDVTWGDPAYPGGEEFVVPSEISYDYLCLTTDEILRDDHRFANESMWPACDAMTYDYYRLAGRLYDELDEGVLSTSFWDQYEAGSDCVSFKFTNDDAYVAARDSLAAGLLLYQDIQYLFEQLGKAGSPYSYQYVDSLRILKIFL
ncbi:MAG: hypothetical protein J6S63_07370 [Atopobiaceae bacterium]|nr:hypothetical protein [Atopobiaceae bacterium]